MKNNIKGDAYLPHILASGLIILLTAQAWWGLRKGAEADDWNFGFYVLSLCTPALYYFMAEVLSPKDSETNIKTVYWERIRAAMIIASVALANNMLVFFLQDDSEFEMKRQSVRFLGIAIALITAYSRQVWVHYVGYGLGYISFFTFVAISN